MFKDPMFLALASYLAGHVVHYLVSRPLHIPAAAVAKTPALGVINALEESLGPAAEAAVNAAIARKLGIFTTPPSGS